MSPAFVPMTNIDGTNISKCEMVAQLKEYSKIDFSSFWHDLGFGGSFFLVTFQFKKYLKIVFSSFWHDLRFGSSFFLVRSQLKKVFEN